MLNDKTARFKEILLVEFRHYKTRVDEHPLSHHQAHIVKLTLVEREVNNIVDILEDSIPEKQSRVIGRIEYLKVKLAPTKKWFGQSEAGKLITILEQAASTLPVASEQS